MLTSSTEIPSKQELMHINMLMKYIIKDLFEIVYKRSSIYGNVSSCSFEFVASVSF